MVNCHIKKYLIIFFVLVQGLSLFLVPVMMKYWKWSICPLIRKWWISKVKPERKI